MSLVFVVGGTSWPLHRSVEVTHPSPCFHLIDVTLTTRSLTEEQLVMAGFLVLSRWVWSKEFTSLKPDGHFNCTQPTSSCLPIIHSRLLLWFLSHPLVSALKKHHVFTPSTFFSFHLFHTSATSLPLSHALILHLAPGSWHTWGCLWVTRVADTSDAKAEHVYNSGA